MNSKQKTNSTVNKKVRNKGISKDLRRNLHDVLYNFAKFYMVRLRYKFYDLRETIPDLIASDKFGNLIAIEALTHPTPRAIQEKIRRYRLKGVKSILFVVPYLTDEMMDVILGKPDVDVIDAGLAEGEEVIVED